MPMTYSPVPAPRVPERERAGELLSDTPTAQEAADPLRKVAAAYADALGERRERANLALIATGLAHFTLNPLAAVRNDTAVLEGVAAAVARLGPGGDDDETPDDLAEDLLEVVADLRAAADQLGALVAGMERLVDSGRTLVLAPVPVAAAVSAARATAAEALQGVCVSTEIPPDARLIADRRLLHAVLVELLQNAGQVLNGSGNVWLRLHACPEEPGGGPASAMLAVVDDGPGVPSAITPHLFLPFVTGGNARTARVGGAPRFGLGLATARGHARAMRGDLVHEPREGGGAAFTLLLGVG